MKYLISACIITLFCCSCSLTAQQAQFSDLIQNIGSREKISLNGSWNIIIDPLENGYYNHRWQPKEDGYFQNAQMQSPSDLIEYNFDSDYQLQVPGDWNTQMD
ncbi:MAG: hypothetical protein KDD01_20855, partial [Phaeodactylibacter sp.]|nr:hypothetical protein [Phaeodactylibacter sp.]